MKKDDKVMAAYMKMIIKEQAETNDDSLEAVLGTSDDAVNQDVSWLLTHCFDLDEEQYEMYSLINDHAKVRGHEYQVCAYYHFKDQEWHVYFNPINENGEGFATRNNEGGRGARVKDALEEAYKYTLAELDGKTTGE